MLPIENSEINKIIFNRIKSFLILFAVIFSCIMYYQGVRFFAPETQDPDLIIAEDFYYNIYSDEKFHKFDDFCLKYEECKVVDKKYSYNNWNNKKDLAYVSVKINDVFIEIDEDNHVLVNDKTHAKQFFVFDTQIFYYYVYSLLFTIALIVIGANTMERYSDIGSKDVTPPHSKFKNNGYMYCFFFFAIVFFFIVCYLNKTYFIINEYDFYDNVTSEFYRNIVFYYTLGFSLVCFIMYLIYDEINENIDKKLKQNNKSKNIS